MQFGVPGATISRPSLAAMGILGGLALAASWVMAEDMSVPMDRQIYSILKILTYDRNLIERMQPELRIGIVYVAEDPQSVETHDDLLAVLQALADKTVKGLPFAYLATPFVSGAELEQWARSNQVNVLYVTPGNSTNLDEILQVSRDLQIMTTTGVLDYVRRGVAVGVSAVLDKPKPLINLPSCKLERSEFDASLLRISMIFR